MVNTQFVYLKARLDGCQKREEAEHISSYYSTTTKTTSTTTTNNNNNNNLDHTTSVSCP